MRKVWMPLLLFLLPTFVFADSASEEIKQLQERVKQLEQKQQIESLKIRVKELEQEKSENKHSTIRPFLGGMVGGWGENNYNLATSFSLGGSAGLSLKYGGVPFQIYITREIVFK